MRALSQELKVNPNTAQRIVALLVEAGLLAVEPGIGTVVTSARRAAARPTRRPGGRNWRRSRTGSPSRWWSKPAGSGSASADLVDMVRDALEAIWTNSR